MLILPNTMHFCLESYGKAQWKKAADKTEGKLKEDSKL